MTCLWEVVRARSPGDEFPFLIRAGEDFSLRHLETGLFLSPQGSGFVLEDQ